MDFRSICKTESYVDISGDIRKLAEHCRWTSLVMPKGYGKTTLLSMLYYFFDKDEESEDLFLNSIVERMWSDWKEYLNARVVLALDFSDFEAHNMQEAIRYVKDKMVYIYKQKLHLFLDDETYRNEAGISVLLKLEEQKKQGSELVEADIDMLKESLKNLLHCFYHGEYSRLNPVLLIDNLCNLEKIARINGYGSEMERFLHGFLNFEPDKSCFIYLQVGDEPACANQREKIDCPSEYFCYDPPFLPHSEHMRWRKDDEAVWYERCVYDAEIKERADVDAKTQEIQLLRGEVMVLTRENQSLKYEEKSRLKKRERYGKPLCDDIPKYSHNMGMRNLRRVSHGEKYDTLNDQIKLIYRNMRQAKSYQDIYEYMQNVDAGNPTDWDDAAYAELADSCGKLREGYEVSSHSNGQYWHQICVGDRKGSFSIAKIKVYVTSAGREVKELYIGAVRELILHGRNGFESMVSKIVRDGTICFFVSRPDFFILEQYMQRNEKLLRKGNPFIAHRGLLGISRDLMDIDSHNAQQAKLLWDYFQMVQGEEDIDVEEMYRMFVLGWNAELAEDNPFCKDFSECTAQMFVLMMDSLEVLLGREITDEDLLLNDDGQIWYMLGNAWCWGALKYRDK